MYMEVSNVCFLSKVVPWPSRYPPPNLFSSKKRKKKLGNRSSVHALSEKSWPLGALSSAAVAMSWLPSIDFCTFILCFMTDMSRKLAFVAFFFFFLAVHHLSNSVEERELYALFLVWVRWSEWMKGNNDGGSKTLCHFSLIDWLIDWRCREENGRIVGTWSLFLPHAAFFFFFCHFHRTLKNFAKRGSVPNKFLNSSPGAGQQRWSCALSRRKISIAVVQMSLIFFILSLRRFVSAR